MLKYKKILLFSITLFIILVLNTDISAQCAMCKSTIESSRNGGSSTADTINYGIVYLMAIPYLAVTFIGIMFYRSYKKKTETRKTLSEIA